MYVNNENRQRPDKQSGAALVVTLLFLLITTIIGVASMRSATTQERLSNNFKLDVEALNNAETGLADAVGALDLANAAADGFDDELDANSGWSRTSATDYANATKAIHYTTRIIDDDDGDGNLFVDVNNVVLLQATGGSASGGVRSVVVRLTGALWTSNKALLTNEDLEISGNSLFPGSNGDIHSNGDITISGNPTTGDVSATGTATNSGGGNIGGIYSGADGIMIPEINVLPFKKHVDFVFKADGRIYYGPDYWDAGLRGSQAGYADGTEWRGWKYNGTDWEAVGGEPMQGGDLYFETNLKVPSNPTNGYVPVAENGDSFDFDKLVSPWTVSLLVEGSLEMSGNPEIDDYKDPYSSVTDAADPEGFQNILFMADTDVKINGNASQSFEGVIAAGEQVDVSGNPLLEGYILAGAQDNTSDLVKDGNHISGNMTLQYSGIASPFFDGVKRLSWQEVGI